MGKNIETHFQAWDASLFLSDFRRFFAADLKWSALACMKKPKPGAF